jgi:hypothetical protein
MQIDASPDQGGDNPGGAHLPMGLPPTPGSDVNRADSNVRLFTVDASTRLCTVRA